MKKTMLVLAVLAMVAMITAPAFAAGAMDTFDTYTPGNFNSQGGWSTDSPGTSWLQIDSTQSDSPSNSAKIKGGATGSGGRLVGNATTWSGMSGANLYVSFDIKGTTGGSTCWGLYVNDMSNTNLLRFYGTSSTVRGRNGGGGSVTSQVALTLTAWDHVDAVINTVAHTAEVWLNGTSIGTVSSLASSSSTLGRIQLEKMDNSPTGNDVFIDNLYLGNEALVTPEPGSLLALGSGMIGMFGFAIRRRRA